MKKTESDGSVAFSALPIFTLLVLAVAQPVFEQLSLNPEYLVIKDCKPYDLFFIVLFLCFILPGAVALTGYVFRKSGTINRAVSFLVFLVFVLVAVVKWFTFSGLFQLLIAVLSSAVLTFAYYSYRSVRQFISFLSLALIVVPILFLYQTFPHFARSDAWKNIRMEVQTPAPVIMVLFDEFPLDSILNRSGTIDPVRFPHFSAFAAESYWFSNASAVANFTTDAIPAILTGRYPEPHQLPTVYEHPVSLFTVLGHSYKMHVLEHDTRLCPPELNQRSDSEVKDPERIGSLLSDLSVVLLHLVTPADWNRFLPPVTQKWDDFWTVDTNRIERFLSFSDSIKPGNRALYFIHIELPHGPWIYLPSGQLLEQEEVAEFIRLHFPDRREEWALATSMAQYLLQTALTDRLLGNLLARLDETGLYEESLVVVLADHGATVGTSEYRDLDGTNHRDILAVPLLIKLPGQSSGVRNDANVELIDVLPTISQVLGVRIPGMQGKSLIDDTPNMRKTKKFYDHTQKKFWEFDPEIIRNPSRQTEWFIRLLEAGLIEAFS